MVQQETKEDFFDMVARKAKQLDASGAKWWNSDFDLWGFLGLNKPWSTTMSKNQNGSGQLGVPLTVAKEYGKSEAMRGIRVTKEQVPAYYRDGLFDEEVIVYAHLRDQGEKKK